MRRDCAIHKFCLASVQRNSKFYHNLIEVALVILCLRFSGIFDRWALFLQKKLLKIDFLTPYYQEHEISLAASHEPEVPIIEVGAEDELTPVLPESDTLVTETLSFPPEINFPTNYPPLMIFNPAPGVTVSFILDNF